MSEIDLKSTKYSIHYLPESNFIYNRNSTNGSLVNGPKVLIVIFSWFLATERHLDKYRKLYLKKGYDVLTVRTGLLDFLLPKIGSKVIAANLLRFLEDEKINYEFIVCHGFSIGVYQLGEFLVHLQEKEKEYGKKSQVKQLLKGLIFDSPVDVNHAHEGIAYTITKNSFLQWIIKKLILTYFQIFYQIATRHYNCASAFVKNNLDKFPLLMLLSKDDIVSDYEHMIRLIKNWKENGVEMCVKIWNKSLHVSHYYRHPNEYLFMIDTFLNQISVPC